MVKLKYIFKLISFIALSINLNKQIQTFSLNITTTFVVFRGNVTLTDLPENLQQLKQNVDENAHSFQGSAKAVSLKWGSSFELEPFDFLLMADCIYYPEVRTKPILFFSDI